MKFLKKYEDGSALVQLEGEDFPTITWISKEQVKIVELFKMLAQKGRAEHTTIFCTTPMRPIIDYHSCGYYSDLCEKKDKRCRARVGSGLKKRCGRNVSKTSQLHCKQHEKLFIKLAKDNL